MYSTYTNNLKHTTLTYLKIITEYGTIILIYNVGYLIYNMALFIYKEESHRKKLYNYTNKY